MKLPIEHIPISLGLDPPPRPLGRLRLTYEDSWEDEDGEEERLIADFALDRDFSAWVRLEFDGPFVVRIAQESDVSTATDSSRWTGDLATFAREVRGDDFSAMHDLFFILNPGSKHYQFVTSNACLDVLAVTPPRASLAAGSKTGRRLGT